MAPVNYPPYRLLEAWRGLACLWVLVYHSNQQATSVTSVDAPAAFAAVARVGYLGVQFFFVISGYCIAHSACSLRDRGRGAGQYLGARLRRIFPTYWLALVLYAASALAMGALHARGLVGSSNSAERGVLGQPPLYYLANLTLTQTPLSQTFLAPISWTLNYEVAFYLIVCLALLTRWPSRSMLSALHALTALSLILLIRSPAAPLFPLDLWPQFGLGVLVFDVVNGAGARGRGPGWSCARR